MEALGITEKDVDDAYESVAHHIAIALTNTTSRVCPEVIVIGGGVIQKEGLIEKVREHYSRLMNWYLLHPKFEQLETYIVTSKYKKDNGILSALSLVAK